MMTSKPAKKSSPKSSPKGKGKPKAHTKSGPQSSKKENPLETRQTIITTALHLAARDGWAQVSFESIAAEADIALTTIRAHFRDRYDILRAYEESIDERVLSSVGTISADDNPREILFDMVMERFDALNEQRDGMIAILDAGKCDPKLVAQTMPHLGQSMATMLEAIQIETSGPKGIAHILGLTGVYLLTLKTWREDESADMSKTMAALDRNLGRAEKLGATLGLI